MLAQELTDYQMGRIDYEEGHDPIPDFDENDPSDVEYMRGYDDAMNESFWDDVFKMAK